jgi:dihydrofolate synthase/folylpolyglutamate synthase
VIIGEWQKETADVFNGKALAEAAPIHFASKHLFLESNKRELSIHHYKIRTRKELWFEDLGTDMTGPYQHKNICTVLEAIWCWNKYYPEKRIKDQQIKKGLSKVKKSTGMLGRWMVIRKKPFVITDAAHNHHGMKAMLPELLKIPVRHRHFVLGFVSDKDISKILAMFPNHGKYYWCTPDIPRGKPVSETMEIGKSLGLSGEAHSSVYAAFQSAMHEAGKQDLVFIGGSSYVVGDFLAGYQENKKA